MPHWFLGLYEESFPSGEGQVKAPETRPHPPTSAKIVGKKKKTISPRRRNAEMSTTHEDLKHMELGVDPIISLMNSPVRH